MNERERERKRDTRVHVYIKVGQIGDRTARKHFKRQLAAVLRLSSASPVKTDRREILERCMYRVERSKGTRYTIVLSSVRSGRIRGTKRVYICMYTIYIIPAR